MPFYIGTKMLIFHLGTSISKKCQRSPISSKGLLVEKQEKHPQNWLQQTNILTSTYVLSMYWKLLCKPGLHLPIVGLVVEICESMLILTLWIQLHYQMYRSKIRRDTMTTLIISNNLWKMRRQLPATVILPK